MFRSCMLIAGLVLLAAPGTARADAIDGNWCNGTGKQMQIQGPSIVTPGGTRMEGRYSRHSFAYTVPERETPAGKSVTMVLTSETTIRLNLDGAEPGEVWHRCEQTS